MVDARASTPLGGTSTAITCPGAIIIGTLQHAANAGPAFPFVSSDGLSTTGRNDGQDIEGGTAKLLMRSRSSDRLVGVRCPGELADGSITRHEASHIQTQTSPTGYRTHPPEPDPRPRCGGPFDVTPPRHHGVIDVPRRLAHPTGVSRAKRTTHHAPSLRCLLVPVAVYSQVVLPGPPIACSRRFGRYLRVQRSADGRAGGKGEPHRVLR